MINIIVTIVTIPNGEVFFYCPDFRYNRHIVRKGEEMMLDERAFSERLKTDNQKTFFKMIEDYEKSIAPSMRAQGFKRINQKERTVIFSFGEMTFSRSRWKKVIRLESQ